MKDGCGKNANKPLHSWQPFFAGALHEHCLIDLARHYLRKVILSIDQIAETLDGLTFAEATAKLREFDSYNRAVALVLVLCRSPTPADTVRVFLEWGNICDAPWWQRSDFANQLRWAIRKVALADYLEPPARTFYDALPKIIPVWRGCERGRERGLYWTTDRSVAEGFAEGKRFSNKRPTVVQAQIPKPHIFAVFVNRQESEIVLDPRRLRKLSHAPYCRVPIDQAGSSLKRTSASSLI